MPLAKIITREIMCRVFEKDSWLYWCTKNSKRIRNSSAGWLDKSGYYIIRIFGKNYFNHRILYQIYHNVILTETDVIDHIDTNKTNNRKENLRLSTVSENGMNRKVQKNNKSSGIKNIYILHRVGYDEYSIKIIKNKKIVFSKLFPITTPIEEVIRIRDEQLKLHHGEFMNKG